MGTAIISGLTFGTFLTLVIMPVLYSSFDSLATHVQRFIGRASTATESSNGAVTPEIETVTLRPDGA